MNNETQNKFAAILAAEKAKAAKKTVLNPAPTAPKFLTVEDVINDQLRPTEDAPVITKPEPTQAPKVQPAPTASPKATVKQQSTQAQAAQAIREELKQAFTQTKFAITSKGYSMGDSVAIEWQDGPTVNEVQKITGKYQYGHFNGMEDIYEYSNTRADIPQTKFVLTTRTQTHEATAPAKAPEAKTGQIQVIDYSEKSFAVTGEDTRKIKDILLDLGGKPNWHLKNIGFGYIFSKKRLDAVIKALSELKKPTPPDPETIEAEAQEQEGREQAEEITIEQATAPVIPVWEAKQRAEAAEAEDLQKELAKTWHLNKNPKPLKEEPKQYTTLQDIEDAAEAGQVIDLTNLYQLVNEKPKAKPASMQTNLFNEPPTLNYVG